MIKKRQHLPLRNFVRRCKQVASFVLSLSSHLNLLISLHLTLLHPTSPLSAVLALLRMVATPEKRHWDWGVWKSWLKIWIAYIQNLYIPLSTLPIQFNILAVSIFSFFTTAPRAISIFCRPLCIVFLPRVFKTNRWFKLSLALAVFGS